MTAYYALTNSERIVDLGEQTDFDAAGEAAPVNVIWIFDRAGLDQVRDDIYALIGD